MTSIRQVSRSSLCCGTATVDSSAPALGSALVATNAVPMVEAVKGDGRCRRRSGDSNRHLRGQRPSRKWWLFDPLGGKPQELQKL